MDAGPTESPVQIRWVVRLRWAAIGAQIASVFGVKYLLHAPFPLAPLVAIIGVLALANVALAAALRKRPTLSERAIAANLVLDVVALTGLLVWTGGAMNPFTTLYLLQVALAAVLVSRRWSLLVTAIATLAFGGLLVARPEAIHVWHSGSMFLLHVRGMWLAFALTAGCLWFFVERVSAALRRRERQLAQAKLEAARIERLAALGTLIAGTAHELNTPLGTVTILASELRDTLGDLPDARGLAESIRSEVRRCSEILGRMHAIDATPEPIEPVELGPWLEATIASWRRDDVIETGIEDGAARTRVAMRPEAFRKALASILDNARAAVERSSDRAIAVRARRDGTEVVIEVHDRGGGIPQEHLPRVGEPFFTTREPGKGMGLGLFLAQATVAQLGGSLHVRSDAGSTVVAVRVPLQNGAAKSA